MAAGEAVWIDGFFLTPGTFRNAVREQTEEPERTDGKALDILWAPGNNYGLLSW